MTLVNFFLFNKIIINFPLTDPKSKFWTFPLSSYDILISKFQDLKPGVTVSGIPRNVLNTMKTPSPDLKNIDISKIDKELRDTLMPFQEDGIRFVNLKEKKI